MRVQIKNKVWDKEAVQELLDRSDEAVARAFLSGCGNSRRSLHRTPPGFYSTQGESDVKTYLTEEGIEVSGEGLDYLRSSRGDTTVTTEPWNKHTPGDPMPCKCGDSVVEVKMRCGDKSIYPARRWYWGRVEAHPNPEITDWRFVERKGEDVIAEPLPREKQIELMAGAEERHAAFAARVTAADPYDALEWDEDDIATVVLKKPGMPWWVRDDDLVRFSRDQDFMPALNWSWPLDEELAFQIKRRPVLTPAEPQLLALLAAATDEADAIRSAARRANIEVPE